MCSWQAVVMRLRITQGTEGYACIGKTPDCPVVAFERNGEGNGSKGK